MEGLIILLSIIAIGMIHGIADLIMKRFAKPKEVEYHERGVDNLIKDIEEQVKQD